MAISLDCADPQPLADFYRTMLGGQQLWAKEFSVGLEVPGAVLVAEQFDGYLPPVWPGTSIVHLDLTCEDRGTAAARATALGATVAEQEDPRCRGAARLRWSPVLPDALTPDADVLTGAKQQQPGVVTGMRCPVGCEYLPRLPCKFRAARAAPQNGERCGGSQ